MTTPQFILRTARGTPVMAFDDRTRALAERDNRQRRGVNLSVWRVEQVEEQIP